MLLVLFGDCFLFISIVCLYVLDVWCVESEQFVEFAEGEGFEDSEQQQGFVEGKFPWSYPLYLYNMHLISPSLFYCLH